MNGQFTKSAILALSGVVLLAASILVAAFLTPAPGEFPWGIHLVTIPAVLLVGVVIGWLMRDRQAAEERARAQIDAEKSA